MHGIAKNKKQGQQKGWGNIAETPLISKCD